MVAMQGVGRHGRQMIIVMSACTHETKGHQSCQINRSLIWSLRIPRGLMLGVTHAENEANEAGIAYTLMYLIKVVLCVLMFGVTHTENETNEAGIGL